jgi:ATP-dependent protease HslVU (ClpYQ) peptidase subunit
MTCIVGLVDEGKVYIGGDSAAVSGLSLTIRKDKKVFRNGDFLIGGTTSFRMLQLLHYAFVPPAYDASTDLEKYMATAFVDALRECLKAGGYATKEKEQESGGVFLVGFQGHLFCIYSDYQVQEALSGYDACGSGDDVALGVLYATPDLHPRKRIELALQGAEQHNGGVRAPFYVEVLEQ